MKSQHYYIYMSQLLNITTKYIQDLHSARCSRGAIREGPASPCPEPTRHKRDALSETLSGV